MDWLRLHTSTLDCVKIQKLPCELFRHWVNLLCLSKIHEGSIPVDVIAFRLRCSDVAAAELLRKLQEAKLLTYEAGIIRLHDWEEHQMPSDDSAERVRRHRAKKQVKPIVTPVTVGVTLQPPLLKRPVTENVTVQSREEKSREEKSRDREACVSKRFEELWERWPRKEGRDFAFQDWLSVVTVSVEDQVFACADRYLSSGDVSRGVVRNLGTKFNGGEIKLGWIMDCSKDQWKSDWPRPAPHQNGKPSSTDLVAEAKRLRAERETNANKH